MDFYQHIIDDLRYKYETNEHIRAMFVTGSVARGEAHKGNDLDVLFVGNPIDIPHTEYKVDNSLVELGGNTLAVMLQRIIENPMQVYMYLDATAVFDKDNDLPKLQAKSQRILDNYKPTATEIKTLKKWHTSVIDKLAVAKENHDTLKVGFQTSSVLWKIVEGLYAINSLPTPASTSALRRISKLEILPEQFSEIWEKILVGNLDQRSSATLELIHFILSKID